MEISNQMQKALDHNTSGGWWSGETGESQLVWDSAMGG